MAGSRTVHWLGLLGHTCLLLSVLAFIYVKTVKARLGVARHFLFAPLPNMVTLSKTPFSAFHYYLSPGLVG